MLYETAARASEVLALNVADLDLAHRRAVVIGKGGRAELIGWETKTARLLPRLLHQRREGPLFLADIAPAPARQPALADLDADSGRARLRCRRTDRPAVNSRLPRFVPLSDKLHYRLATSVPASWLPLVPLAGGLLQLNTQEGRVRRAG